MEKLVRSGIASLALALLLWPASTAGADPCADAVTSYTVGTNGGFQQDLLPDIVLGAPYGTGATLQSLDVASLGDGGSITIAFTDNQIVDGPGADFTIFENVFIPANTTTPFTEAGVVAASADGVNFFTFPHGPGLTGVAGVTPVYANADTNTIDPRDPAVSGGDSFDLAAVGLASARFLRITDPGAAIDDYGNHFPTPGPGKSGFDLDAAIAIHSQDTCAACCDADGSGSVKANDVLLLLRAASQLPTAINLCGSAPCDGRACGDANDDRKLTAADVLLCLRLASSLPTAIALCSTGDCDFQ